MKGLKMRTPPIESIIKIMEALGANPVSVPFADLYMALKTGVADGQENPLVNIYTTKVYEVQKYLTIVNYQYHPLPFVVNLKWYKSLKPEYQKILKECAEEAMIYNDDLVKNLSEEYYTKLEKNMEINALTYEQKELFKKAAASVYNYYITKGLFTKEELEKIEGVFN
jgi:C4-dicarboxylate-binding protein DctP